MSRMTMVSVRLDILSNNVRFGGGGDGDRDFGQS